MNSRGTYSYTFAALRGIQAGRTFYVAMCPLHLIPRIFLYDEDELPAEIRAQRPLNRSRIPAIAQYMLDNPREYVFSSITASVDGDVAFEPVSLDSDLGQVVISMASKFIINDGQHRRAAIEEAIRQNPTLGDETISVVLFVDGGLHRSQQMFADLNQYATRPNKSINILYDLRSPLAQLARKLVDDVAVFRTLTETARSSISNRSIKLFTLSSIHQGTKSLLGKKKSEEITDEELVLASRYWNEVAKHFPEWQLAASRKVIPAELRREFVHSHGIALHALGLMGNALLAADPKHWPSKLKALNTINWERKNTDVWEGRAMAAGRISKATTNVLLTSALLKKTLSLPLNREEQRLETLFKRNAK